MRTIKSNIKQALSGFAFVGSAILIALIALLTSLPTISDMFYGITQVESSNSLYLIQSTLNSKIMMVALPVLCALQCTTVLIDDVKSGFIKEYLPRTTRRAYVSGKCISCATAGALIMPTGAILAHIMLTHIMLPLKPNSAVPVATSMYGEFFNALIMPSICGAFWSMVGLTFGTLTFSKYTAYASPFVLYYLLIILSERYFEEMYILYPPQWLNPTENWRLGKFGAVLFVCGCIAVLSVLFMCAAKKRIKSI